MRHAARCTRTFINRGECRRYLRTMTALLAIAFTTSCAGAQRILPQSDHQDFQQQAYLLLKQMTVEEKIGQLNQHFLTSKSKTIDEGVMAGKYGSFQFMTDPATINRLQHVAVEKSRLHIPLLFAYDVIHGFHTIFPVPLAMSASWDTDLVVHSNAIAAEEASAVGIRWTFAPMVDIARDARWGRIVEGAGEDPFLGSAMARAEVEGFQGDMAGQPDHILACLKHFAAYGAAEGGRDYDAAYVPEDQLRNVYLPPFRAGVKAGAETVMSAYMDLNDVPATGNKWLLHDVLRKDWGFRGFVPSDAGAVGNLVIHGFATDEKDAALRAFTSGVNVDLGSKAYPRNLEDLLHEGKITEAQLDEAVRPILEAKY
jgi:beta-glucosidase